MRWQDIDQQPCSLARTLAIVGDRWTLLVLRDCFLGVRRFEQFQERLGVTRHVLSDRLRKLQEGGILDKVAYQERPRREEYRLTARGRDLYPVIVHLAQWGDTYLAGEEGPPLVRIHRQCGEPLAAQLQCGHCGETVAARDIRVEENPYWAGEILINN
ncbi:putative transcriptional regulator [Alcanivorax hongdengensis A-11-3]|uniref:Putative transcriptional regulator n=1 Tax=Alcanivorax hongdengensis A-11-3 TaxID=1177179 RepID=L0WBM9_9GAMM|nr:helix-turn-helix domain-containing protein [Alcanivorax hongdengensis]EKF73492.1 putative transcriptional regulator [Alcanivorax hongdengensis A-11-3]